MSEQPTQPSSEQFVTPSAKVVGTQRKKLWRIVVIAIAIVLLLGLLLAMKKFLPVSLQNVGKNNPKTSAQTNNVITLLQSSEQDTKLLRDQLKSLIADNVYEATATFTKMNSNNNTSLTYYLGLWKTKGNDQVTAKMALDNKRLIVYQQITVRLANKLNELNDKVAEQTAPKYFTVTQQLPYTCEITDITLPLISATSSGTSKQSPTTINRKVSRCDSTWNTNGTEHALTIATEQSANGVTSINYCTKNSKFTIIGDCSQGNKP